MNEHAAKIEARFRNYLIVVNEQDYTAARKAAQILAGDIHDTDIPSILAFLAMELTGKHCCLICIRKFSGVYEDTKAAIAQEQQGKTKGCFMDVPDGSSAQRLTASPDSWYIKPDFTPADFWTPDIREGPGITKAYLVCPVLHTQDQTRPLLFTFLHKRTSEDPTNSWNSYSLQISEEPLLQQVMTVYGSTMSRNDFITKYVTYGITQPEDCRDYAWSIHPGRDHSAW